MATKPKAKGRGKSKTAKPRQTRKTIGKTPGGKNIYIGR